MLQKAVNCCIEFATSKKNQAAQTEKKLKLIENELTDPPKIVEELERGDPSVIRENSSEKHHEVFLYLPDLLPFSVSD